MKFVILFEDDPGADKDIRRRHMPAHLDFLEGHADRIAAAGPLTSDGGVPAGGLWLVEAADEGEADALVKADPFWPTGLRKSVRILAWTQVYTDGKRVTPG